jgi:hypothetical protein
MANDAYKVRRILDILREPPKAGVPAELAEWLTTGVKLWRGLDARVRAEMLVTAYAEGKPALPQKSHDAAVARVAARLVKEAVEA